MRKPIVVQHSFGEVGGGGPIGALRRLLESKLAAEFEFHQMHQPGPLGGLSPQLLRQWRGFLREIQPDIVHVRGLGNEGFHGAVAARAARVPHVLVSVHGTHRDLQMPSGLAGLRATSVRRGLEPATLSLATHIATVCEYAAVRPFIARWGNKFSGVVPNGVDVPQPCHAARMELRDEWGVVDSDVVIVSVGRLSIEKGLGDLAAAMRIAGSQDPGSLSSVRVVVVGDGPDGEALQAAFAGVPGLGTRFLGRRSDVDRILNAADLFVMPSWHENLSNALLEAMAAGLPVVATEVGGNTEVLQGNGVLVEAQAPAALAAAVMGLVANPRERARLGMCGRQRVIEKYTASHMATGWGVLYRRVLEG